jgi:hypothetical protein
MLCRQAANRPADWRAAAQPGKTTYMSGSPRRAPHAPRPASALGPLGLAGRHDGNALAPRGLGVRGLLGCRGRALAVLQRRDDCAGLLDHGRARQVAVRARAPSSSGTGFTVWDPPSLRAQVCRARPSSDCSAAGGMSTPARLLAAGVALSRRQAAGPEPQCGAGRSRSRPCAAGLPAAGYTWRLSRQTP